MAAAAHFCSFPGCLAQQMVLVFDRSGVEAQLEIHRAEDGQLPPQWQDIRDNGC